MLRALVVVGAVFAAVGCQHDCTPSPKPWHRPARLSGAQPFQGEQPLDAVEPEVDPAYPETPDLTRPPLPDVPPKPPGVDVKAEDFTAP